MRLTVFVKLPNLISDKRSKTSASSSGSGSGSAKVKTSMSGHQVKSNLHTKFLEEPKTVPMLLWKNPMIIGEEDGKY